MAPLPIIPDPPLIAISAFDPEAADAVIGGWVDIKLPSNKKRISIGRRLHQCLFLAILDKDLRVLLGWLIAEGIIKNGESFNIIYPKIISLSIGASQKHLETILNINPALDKPERRKTSRG